MMEQCLALLSIRLFIRLQGRYWVGQRVCLDFALAS